MSVCVGTFFDEVDNNMERLGAAIPKDAQGSGEKMLDWIGKLAAASALNPATPATAVVGGAGVIPMAVGLAGVSAAWYGGLLLGSMMKAGVIKASCGLQGAMAFLRYNGIYDIQAIENEMISDPRLMALVE